MIFYISDPRCRGVNIGGLYQCCTIPPIYQHQTCDDNLTLNGALCTFKQLLGENSIENKQGRSVLKRKIKIKVRPGGIDNIETFHKYIIN